jgi:hypothetical protein
LSSEIEQRLDEINSKLQLILENSFLSRLDLMFSILFSLTIFVIGLTLNRILLQIGFFPIYLGSILVLFAWTLAGEFWAIITNNIIMRFKFWIALVFGISILALFSPLSLLPRQYSPEFLSFILIWMFWGLFRPYVDKLFYKYVRKFPSRFPSGKFPIKAWTTLLFPAIIGYILFAVVFVALYLHFMLGVT